MADGIVPRVDDLWVDGDGTRYRVKHCAKDGTYPDLVRERDGMLVYLTELLPEDGWCLLERPGPTSTCQTQGEDTTARQIQDQDTSSFPCEPEPATDEDISRWLAQRIPTSGNVIERLAARVRQAETRAELVGQETSKHVAYLESRVCHLNKKLLALEAERDGFGERAEMAEAALQEARGGSGSETLRLQWAKESCRLAWKVADLYKREAEELRPTVKAARAYVNKPPDESVIDYSKELRRVVRESFGDG